MSQPIQIPSTVDRKVIDVFVKLKVMLGAPHLNGNLIGDIPFSCNAEGQPDAALTAALEKDGSFIENIVVSTTGFNVSYTRGGGASPGPANVRSSIWDSIQFNGDHQCPPERKLEAIDLVLTELQPFKPGRAPTTQDSNTSAELVAIHSSILEKLEHTNTDLVEQTTGLQRQLRKDAETLIADEKEKVEKWRGEVETELANKQSSLNEFKRQLDERQQQIDDRSNTHARRDARDKLLDEVKNRVEKFGISEATSVKRQPVAKGMLLLIGIFLSLAFFTGLEIFQAHSEHSNAVSALGTASLLAERSTDKDVALRLAAKLSEINTQQPDMIWLWLRLSLTVLGLVGSVVYYIRWQDRWANQHAAAEWQLRQFQLDISRANWVIESGLEWNKSTGALMTDALVDRVTHGLFVKENEPAQVLHPADELATALLGSASKVNLHTPAGDVEFDKPGKIPRTAG